MQQVSQDAPGQEPRLGLLLGGALLENETDPEQHGSHEGGCVVNIQVHGALSSSGAAVPVSRTTCTADG
jgi:hypothetical protein